MDRGDRVSTRIRRLVELRAWMKTHGITQLMLARMAQIAAPTISRVFSGLADFTFEQSWSIAQVTGLPLRVLITGPKALRIYKLSVDQPSQEAENAQ